jgi:NAD(P)H-flavin reductase
MAVPHKMRCRVNDVIDHGDHVYTVDLIPDKTVPQFRPGQFLHLALDAYNPGDFWPDSRVFSIASSPLKRDRLRISYSVRGRFTARMEKELHVNRCVWTKLPYGDFVIDQGRDVVLIAGGTGITAFTAFLDSLTSNFPNNVYLVYGSRQRQLLIYRTLLERLVRDVPRFHVFYFVEHGGDEGPGADEYIGYLSVEPVWPKVLNPRVAMYYLSGPPAMLSAVSQDLLKRNISPESIHVDAWE